MKPCLFFLILFLHHAGFCQISRQHPFYEDSLKLKEALASDSVLISIIQSNKNPYLLLNNYLSKQQFYDKLFLEQESQIRKFDDLGTTKYLEIIPVIEWNTSNEDFISVDGLAYLIKTDEANILFDLGSYNQKPSEKAQFNLVNTKDIQSPLVHNLTKLGISISEIDYIFISHDHYDHTGGNGEIINTKTFYLDQQQFNLEKITIFTPAKMHYPYANLILSQGPRKICKGVASTGIISNYDFFIGELQEQALIIQLEDKGIILISGCGHQTIPKLITRAESCVDQPLYGLLGGLHMVFSDSRNMGFMKYIGTGLPPWSPTSKKDVQSHINALMLKDIKIIGLSAHDSCDSTISMFRKAFDKKYTELVVGESIIFR